MTLSLDDPVADTLTTTELLRIAVDGETAAWERSCGGSSPPSPR